MAARTPKATTVMGKQFVSLKTAKGAHESIAELTTLRNQGIRLARDNGMSLRAIAEAVGISHTMVAKICGEQ